MPNAKCPHLIEVALPICEISAENVRDKSIRYGHISTLHLWWARRPLSVCRAIVFASLVPDPDDDNCPSEFRNAVLHFLKDNIPQILRCYWRGQNKLDNADPYKPHDDIPDTPRNRLLTFIAKWSPEWIAFQRGEDTNQPPPKEMLDDRCLVKWETSDPNNEQGHEILRIARELVKIANDGESPFVLDPFAGGGAIPLEATRLGCQAIANDYNPVSYLILRATCEFPQKYGKPCIRDIGTSHSVSVKNALTYDVEYWAKWILDRAKEKIGHLYPASSDGKPVIGYLWVRTLPCSNPDCRAEIPLLKNLLICNKPNKKVALIMDVQGNDVKFGIAKGRNITRTEGTVIRGVAYCPICKQASLLDDIKKASFDNMIAERMVAVIADTPQSKEYLPVETSDLKAFDEAKYLFKAIEKLSEPMPDNADMVSGRGWNFKVWGDLFNPRQLLAMQTFIDCLHSALIESGKREYDAEYHKAVATYLGLWISRIAQRMSNMGLWNNQGENVEHPFGRQAIPMVWDYPEANPFNEATGGAISQLSWILKVIIHESNLSPVNTYSAKVYYGDSATIQLMDNSVDAVVTDPPYFDSIAYADLSDFFYIWLKRGLGDIFPEMFITPLAPKINEATALKRRHDGNKDKAKKHFISKLSDCFAEAKRVCKRDGIITVMFAHQSTEAWIAFIDALFNAGLNITATYPIATERTMALKKDLSTLASSIAIVCRPRQATSVSSFLDVRREIEKVVADSVRRFWNYGFRGADLIATCYGSAVGIFGKYERVEHADGTFVTVTELLEMAREYALKVI